MTRSIKSRAATAMALVLGAGAVFNGFAANAQSDQYPPPPPPPGQYQPNGYPPPPSYDQQRGYDQSRDYDQQRGADGGPPPGQYAPPPPGAEQPGSVYDDRAQRYDYDYGRRYSGWAARYCIERRNDNAAAGAIIGGVLGAVIGGGMAGRGDHGAGMVVGGALGAGTGALIGASSSAPGGCPPGYVIRSGAPAFYAPADPVFWAPGWYNPWVWGGGGWIYRPYRAWYFNHGAYWRPGWRPGHFEYRYRRW